MDLDSEARLLLIVGTLDQLVLAVDLIIQQTLRSSGQANAASGANGRDTIAVTLLLEHNKVGKVVGVKGSTLQLLKQKSGAVICVEKDPMVRSIALHCVALFVDSASHAIMCAVRDTQELCGVVLRKVLLEGSAGAVRW